MHLPASAAWIYLPVVAPLCLALVWTDLSRMKIPNWITDAMLIAFVPLGLIALPFDVFLWQLVQAAVMFGIGLVLFALRLYGGGDIKFFVSASPYIMLADLRDVFILLSVFLIAGFVLHRIARASPLRQMAPDWVSWTATGKYPMGLSLGPTMIAYLLMSATA